MMKLSKSEKIMALLNQWDPIGDYKKSGDYRVYQYEAETIAQSVRSNSKAATVERVLRETLDVSMGGKELDDDEVSAMARLYFSDHKEEMMADNPHSLLVLLVMC